MNYQKASDTDYQGILALQHKNQLNQLTAVEKENGFLSVEFTEEQFKRMNQESGIVVCKDQHIVCGYLCASSLAFNKAFTIPAAMISQCAQLHYKKQPMDHYRSIIVGPWCVERSHRGTGVFSNLWHALNKILSADIELMITFISTQNPRSLHAAKKVGLEEIATFEFNQQTFYILAKSRQ